MLENSRALDAFLASVEQRAFRMAQLATGNHDDALDLVQDAMMKLVAKYRHKTEQDWPPLFYRILQSRIKDYHRRRAVRNGIFAITGYKPQFKTSEAASAATVVEQYADKAGLEPETATENEQSIERLSSALTQLPLRQQQVFLLRVWEGLDVRETALAMSCSHGSVKTHFSRAIKRLRAELDEVL